jgi:hypothetical protein
MKKKKCKLRGDVVIGDKIETLLDVNLIRTAMSSPKNSNYPIMNDCDTVSIYGGCGLDCPVFEDGRCPITEEVIEGTKERNAKKISPVVILVEHGK